MRDLQQKKALITGAGSGIGRAIALALAAEGTHVYLLDINETAANAVADDARKSRVQAVAARCDVAEPDQISAAIRLLLDRWGAIDILVNGAGVAYYGPTDNMTAAQWDWLLKINLLAPIQFTRELLPTLLAQPEGHILNVCSIAGLVAGGRSAAYQVSKFGLVGFTEALRSEYVRRGVGLTALCPGPVQTNLYRAAISGRPDRPVPEPPAWICASPEQVARKAIRGIQRNSAVVLVTPLAYVLAYAKRLAPGLLDRLNCAGRRKRPAIAPAVPQLRLADLPTLSFAEATAASRANSSSNRAAQWKKLERESLYFDSRGARCEALLMRPDSHEESTPLVVMAHGFAAEKSFGLQPYADHFVRRGLAVMMFDYRHFGGSEGMPRNLVSHRRQRQDWQAALDFAGNLPGIDASRIALWGTSFSGGHVLDCAARNSNVAAVVAQVPMLDVPGSLRGYRTRYFTQAILHGARDLLRAAVFRSPHYVPVVGSNHKFAVMNKPGCESGYRRLVPETADWRNSVPARAVLTSLLNRPIRRAGQVTCPTLFVVAEQDQLAPLRVVRKAAARMSDVKVVTLPGDHFAPYFDESFESAVEQEADFLEGCLIKAVTWSIAAGRDTESGDSEDRPATKNRIA